MADGYDLGSGIGFDQEEDSDPTGGMFRNLHQQILSEGVGFDEGDDPPPFGMPRTAWNSLRSATASLLMAGDNPYMAAQGKQIMLDQRADRIAKQKAKQEHQKLLFTLAEKRAEAAEKKRNTDLWYKLESDKQKSEREKVNIWQRLQEKELGIRGAKEAAAAAKEAAKTKAEDAPFDPLAGRQAILDQARRRSTEIVGPPDAPLTEDEQRAADALEVQAAMGGVSGKGEAGRVVRGVVAPRPKAPLQLTPEQEAKGKLWKDLGLTDDEPAAAPGPVPAPAPTPAVGQAQSAGNRPYANVTEGKLRSTLVDPTASPAKKKAAQDELTARGL